MKSLVQFITHNNAVPLAFMFVLMGGAGAYAANKAGVISVGASQQIDNSVLLQTDVGSISRDVQVVSVVDSGNDILVNYRYHTLEVQDGKWQAVFKDEQLLVRDKSRFPDTASVQTYIDAQLHDVITQDRSILSRAKKQILSQKASSGLDYGALVGITQPKEVVVNKSTTLTDGGVRVVDASPVYLTMEDRVSVSVGPVALVDGSGNNTPEPNQIVSSEVISPVPIAGPVTPSDSRGVSPVTDTATSTTPSSQGQSGDASVNATTEDVSSSSVVVAGEAVASSTEIAASSSSDTVVNEPVVDVVATSSQIQEEGSDQSSQQSVVGDIADTGGQGSQDSQAPTETNSDQEPDPISTSTDSGTVPLQDSSSDPGDQSESAGGVTEDANAAESSVSTPEPDSTTSESASENSDVVEPVVESASEEAVEAEVDNGDPQTENTP